MDPCRNHSNDPTIDFNISIIFSLAEYLNLENEYSHSIDRYQMKLKFYRQTSITIIISIIIDQKIHITEIQKKL